MLAPRRNAVPAFLASALISRTTLSKLSRNWTRYLIVASPSVGTVGINAAVFESVPPLPAMRIVEANAFAGRCDGSHTSGQRDARSAQAWWKRLFGPSTLVLRQP